MPLGGCGWRLVNGRMYPGTSRRCPAAAIASSRPCARYRIGRAAHQRPGIGPRFTGPRPVCSISALCGSVGGRAPSWADRQAAATALSAHACALKAEGRVEEGLAVIERAHALAPESARFTAEVGLFLHAARRYDEEMPMLQRAVAQDRQSADAWLQLGLGFARRGDLAAAIEALDRAASLTADDPRPRQWLEWARAQRRDAVPARQS